MVEIEDIKKWIQIRIDYWEDQIENHREHPIQTLAQPAFKEGEEQGEEQGVLNGLYMVMEFINGQRR